ncbi:exosortase/archaeosortase family protein [Rubellicoccus peritrichatus]|uniref:Exosortase/archaeosortase family protein n=1 Tax=Rubellicoccus peritrichatus TaxID=3080537 RepID=A0AAQ3QSH1_9BACT|nr:exosortase/archaeosortase family protein [Puniceicoccus sp. CR14]WOO42443.1 exosortase/archaeosortase family protein [Puniceicoccus sp. CR14]
MSEKPKEFPHKGIPSRWGLAISLFLVALVVFQFFGNSVRSYIDTGSLFVWWFSQWFNARSETEHGPIILAVSIWLFWRNLQQSKDEPNPARRGLGLSIVIGALALHLLGIAIQQTRISIVAFLFFCMGSAYLLGGKHYGRASAFPLAFMVFSFPLEFLFDEFGFYLRLAVIQMATAIAHLFGIDVIRSGTALFSPDGSFNYDVAPACSGIRSLVALVALSTLLGYLNFRSTWRRGLFLFLAFPFAYLGNVIRILSIILAANWFGQDAGTIVHEWFGFLIFVVVLGLALITVSLLQKFLPEKPRPTVAPAPKPVRASRVPAAMACCVIIVAGVLTATAVAKLEAADAGTFTAVRLDKQGSPIAFPVMLGLDWSGLPAEVSAVEREVLPDDTGYSRTYYRSLENPKDSVLTSVVLSGASRGSIHRPEICLTGQGWTIKGRFPHVFEANGFPEGIPATVLQTERIRRLSDGSEETVPGLFAYFFVGGDRIVPTHWQRMAAAASERLFKLQNHRWAYVFAQTDCLDSEESGLARLETIITQTAPEVIEIDRMRGD